MSLEEQHDSKSESTRKGSDSPVFTCTIEKTCEESSDRTNERVKTDRPASPTSSFLSSKSDLSMDQPTDFREGETLPSYLGERPTSPAPSYLSFKTDLSMDLPTNFKRGLTFQEDTRERPTSPAPSYLSFTTDLSMDLPTNFKRGLTFQEDTRIEEKDETSHVPTFISETSNNPVDTVHYSRGNTSMLKVGSERPPSPTLSSVSEWTDFFAEESTIFKAEETFHLDPRLLTENFLKCPECKSMLKDPVSIPCGHNFCRDCINKFWDSCTEEYVCSECGRGSKIRPELHTNTALAEVVKNLQQAAFSPALPPCSYAGPEDVACDFCTERRLKAVKSCLTCGVFLCETHIRKHYTIPALQKHTLSDAIGAMEMKPSQQNPTDNLLSSIICGQQEEKEKGISESQNTSMSNEAGISTPETEVKKEQQGLLGNKNSFSEFEEHSTMDYYDNTLDSTYYDEDVVDHRDFEDYGDIFEGEDCNVDGWSTHFDNEEVEDYYEEPYYDDYDL